VEIPLFYGIHACVFCHHVLETQPFYAREKSAAYTIIHMILVALLCIFNNGHFYAQKCPMEETDIFNAHFGLKACSFWAKNAPDMRPGF